MPNYSYLLVTKELTLILAYLTLALFVKIERIWKYVIIRRTGCFKGAEAQSGQALSIDYWVFHISDLIFQIVSKGRKTVPL